MTRFNPGDRIQVSPTSDINSHRFIRGKYGTVVEIYPYYINGARKAYWVKMDGSKDHVDLWEDEMIPARHPSLRDISDKVEYVLFDLPSELGKFWVVGVNRGTNEMWVVSNSGLDKEAASVLVNALNAEIEKVQGG